MAFWQWCNFALGEASREPLVINVDESSIAFHWSGLSGTVVRQGGPADKIKTSALRARITYISAITHDVEIQQLLPQVLLGSTRCFTAAFVRQAAELCPRIVVWREKSGWNTHRLMALYLRLLCSQLGGLLAVRQVYLLVDLAPCHLRDSLFDLAYSLGVRLIYVPPSMTSLLQPLDTHVFAVFKHALEENWRLRKAAAPSGQLNLTTWLEVVASAIDFLSSRTWRHAFESDGILRSQQSVSDALLRKLGWSETPAIPSTIVTGALDQVLFPKSWRGNPAKYIQWNPHAEVLKDELEKLKGQRSQLRRAMRENRKAAKNAGKRKKRLLQAVGHLNSGNLLLSRSSV
eukprot:Skav209216  [mRNA]  locus=scaffold603:9755:11004:+ [translate_table: standard]